MKKIFYAMMALVLAASCKTIEDRAELTNSFDRDEIKLSAHQQIEGSNVVTLKLDSKGVVGYWDYLVGNAYSDEVEVVFPYVGKHTFTFQTTTPYIGESLADRDFPSATIEVEVTQIVQEPDAKFKLLTGDDFKGKTWKFNKASGRWWYMADPTNPGVLWWNAPNDGVLPVDHEGKMTFDFDGGANYTYYASADAAPLKTTFALGNNFTELGFPSTEVNLLGVNANAAGPNSFQILELSEEKLEVFAVVAGGTGWVWSFTPAE